MNFKYLAMFKLQPIRITRGDFSCNFVIEVFFLCQNSRGLCKSLIMQNTTHVDECMHSFNVNMHDANGIVKNLIPNISNKGQFPLIPKKVTGDPFFE